MLGRVVLLLIESTAFDTHGVNQESDELQGNFLLLRLFLLLFLALNRQFPDEFFILFLSLDVYLTF